MHASELRSTRDVKLVAFVPEIAVKSVGNDELQRPTAVGWYRYASPFRKARPSGVASRGGAARWGEETWEADIRADETGDVTSRCSPVT